MEEKILKIVFNCENDKTLTLTLTNPKDDIAEEDITDFADNFVDSGIFAVGTGSAVASVIGLKEAYYLETTKTPIESEEPELKEGEE